MTSYAKLLELLNGDQIKKLKEALEENIREETLIESYHLRRPPKGDVIIKRMFKDVKSSHPGLINTMHPMYRNEKDYRCYTDGLRVFADAEIDYGYPEAEPHKRLDMKLFFSFWDNLSVYCEWIEVDVVDLNAFIKMHPKKDTTPYILEFKDGEKIGFNPHYLKDALDFVGTDEIMVSTEKSPALCRSEDRNKLCLLLPINIRKNKEVNHE